MSLKILIVEDDPRSRKLLTDLLTVKGHDVLEAHNGQEGVDLARASAPDLILMDIQMPQLDGLEAMRILKGHLQTRHIPIWVLTSYAMREDTQRICAEGCDLCITKPFDVPSLLRQIETCIPNPQPPLDFRQPPVPADAADSRVTPEGPQQSC